MAKAIRIRCGAVKKSLAKGGSDRVKIALCSFILLLGIAGVCWWLLSPAPRNPVLAINTAGPYRDSTAFAAAALPEVRRYLATFGLVLPEADPNEPPTAQMTTEEGQAETQLSIGCPRWHVRLNVRTGDISFLHGAYLSKDANDAPDVSSEVPPDLPAPAGLTPGPVDLDAGQTETLFRTLRPLEWVQRLTSSRHSFDLDHPNILYDAGPPGPGWEFTFMRKHGGFDFLDEAVRVLISAEPPYQLTYYRLSISDQEPPPCEVRLAVPQIADRIAEITAAPTTGLARFLGKEKAAYDPATLVVAEKPQFVHVNHAFSGPATRSLDLPLRLAYICTLKATHADESGRARYTIELWLDAETGAVLGGDYYVMRPPVDARSPDKTERSRTTPTIAAQRRFT